MLQTDDMINQKQTILVFANNIRLVMSLKVIFSFQPLVKYMIPLFCVYLAEYTINQGLVGVISFNFNYHVTVILMFFLISLSFCLCICALL